MENDEFYYDATGFNTLEGLAELIESAASGEMVAGSEEWTEQLQKMPMDSLNQFNTFEFIQLRLEHELRRRADNAAHFERLQSLASIAIDDLHRLQRPSSDHAS